jgi:ppGpp synthetase/RelA/SpoT-type nucleotidyltranferase
MPRPFSGKQLGKLGRRLAEPGQISDEDYEMLARVAEAYQAVLDKVEQRLRQLGFEATTRVKTTGTLVDKLRRTPTLPLGSIHDVAGARIVIDGGRQEQDQAGDRIMAAFADCPKPPQKIDRRERPSQGYRALHVIVFEDSTPVEIQIRTKVQDAWAQITEKAGDRWGRGLRYGEPLEGLDARQLVKALGGLSNVLDTFERLELQAQQLRTGAQQNQQLTTRIDRIDTLVTKAKENLLAEVKALEGAE